MRELRGALPASTETPVDAAAADVDGDGDLDLVLLSGEPERDLRLLLNDGTGLFTEQADAFPDVDPTSIALGDLDGDGDADLVAGKLDDTVLFNDGTGTFTVGFVIDPALRVTGDVAVGDVDGDGHLDIFLGNVPCLFACSADDQLLICLLYTSPSPRD